MTKSSFIKNIIDDDILIKIPVKDFDGNKIGYLEPITKKTLKNDITIAAKLTAWRNQASKHFLSTFVATEERTKEWILNQVLSQFTKLLFLVYSNSNLVGHFGFANYNDDTAELDNLIRGESGGHPDLILFSEFALIDWMFKELEISTITGQVLCRNIIALLLHKKVGFEIINKIYLKEVAERNETKLVEINENEFKNEKIFKYIILLKKEKFYEIYNGLKNGISEHEN